MENVFILIEKILNIKLTPEEIKILSGGVSIVSFNKGSIPVSEGDVIKNFYFIIEGLVRGFYLDENGCEVTKCFSMEQQIFATECYRTGYASTFYIECLEDCKCIQISYDVLRRINRISELISVLYINELDRLEKRLRDMLLMDGTERYITFTKAYPTLCNRVPIKFIASYIGIKPESLSRIRKAIKNNIC